MENGTNKRPAEQRERKNMNVEEEEEEEIGKVWLRGH